MTTLSPLAQAVAGAICAVLLAAAAYLGGQYATGAYDDTTAVRVNLGELGQGVVSGSDVTVRGVPAGTVGAIRLNEDLEAVAELVLDPGIRLPERATYLVNAKTFLGEKQVEVVFSGPVQQGPFLADGALVDDPDRAVEVGDVLADLADVLGAVDTADLAVVIGDGLGAFDGQGGAIARAVDQGGRATSTLRRSLDDQVAATRDLSLVAEALGPRGGDFNRMGAEFRRGLPTISENQRGLRAALEELSRFSGVLNATLTVDRANLDRLILEGDNVTRMLFAYTPEIGELITGLVRYTEKWPPGFADESFDGQAARFQVFVDGAVEEEVCHELPEEFAGALPLCGEQAENGPRPSGEESPDGAPRADEPLLELPAPPDLTQPGVPERAGVDALLRNTLPPAAPLERNNR